MNKTLETIRGSWITRAHEIAEANHQYVRSAADQIPADLREKFLSIAEWVEHTEEWSDKIIDGACTDSDRRVNEIMFLGAQIKILIEPIRLTKDVDSIRRWRAVTREAIERIEERKREEELKRLQQEGTTFTHSHRPLSPNCRKSRAFIWTRAHCRNEHASATARLGIRGLLRLALFTWWLHARMPPLILSMGIAEPLVARRAAYGRRVCARRSIRRHALTRPRQVHALVFHLISLVRAHHTSCASATMV